MKIALYVMVAILGCASPAGALDLKEITSKPTAGNPQFANKEVWPNLAGDEYFLKEKWPQARLLIWAYPGKSERRQGPKLLTVDQACWIDAATGKPADAIPDMDTEVIGQWKNISFGDACLSKDPNELVCGYEAEIATMKNAGPMSPLEPKPRYTTN
ncbi:MAG: hypothetical protein NTW21_25525 [Verrucomicrobia bacterium]|nr:hypothetical protein [Verrucomicrobiota bacterium]